MSASFLGLFRANMRASGHNTSIAGWGHRWRIKLLLEKFNRNPVLSRVHQGRAEPASRSALERQHTAQRQRQHLVIPDDAAHSTVRAAARAGTALCGVDQHLRPQSMAF